MVWTVLVCILMVMPPNTRAGLAILGVLAFLFVLHRLTGPHEIRKPLWDLAQEAPAASLKSVKTE